MNLFWSKPPRPDADSKSAVLPPYTSPSSAPLRVDADLAPVPSLVSPVATASFAQPVPVPPAKRVAAPMLASMNGEILRGEESPSQRHQDDQHQQMRQDHRHHYGHGHHSQIPPSPLPTVSPPSRPAAPLPLHTMLANTQHHHVAAAAAATVNTTIQRPALPLGPERQYSFFRLSDFILVRPIGTGTFGRVYLARYGKVRYFALKKLRKIDVFRLKQMDHVHNERSLLCSLHHPFIIKLYSAMQDERHLYMLLEYAPGGELFHYLRRAGRLSLDAARFYMAELVLAIEYLHARDIAYRDLKPENLLLDEEGHIKLADFGFAKVVPNLTYTLCGTPEYLAPEIILGRGYGKSVDWWALGILLFEMLTGNPPFNGDTPTAVYERTLKGKVHYPSWLSGDAVEFLSGLLILDATKRLGCCEGGAQRVKEMSFFRGYNWEAVYKREYRPPIIPNCGDPDLALNFPPDDCKSSMDANIPNEQMILRTHGVTFPDFFPA